MSVGSNDSIQLNDIELEFHDQLESTSDYVQEQIENKTLPFAVTAATQSVGRGRRGKSWNSEPGNLYLSLAFSPVHSKIKNPGLMPIVAAVIVARWLKEYFKLSPRIKWPNDILVNRRKIAGILCESSIQGSEWSHIVVGIGINLNNFPKQGLDYQATSVTESLSLGEVSVADAAKDLTSYFWSEWQSISEQKLFDRFYNEQLHPGWPLRSKADSGGLWLTSGHLLQDGSLEIQKSNQSDVKQELTSVNHEQEWMFLDRVSDSESEKKCPFICADIGNTTSKIGLFDHWDDPAPAKIVQVSDSDLENLTLSDLIGEAASSEIDKLSGWPIYLMSVNPDRLKKFDVFCERNRLSSVLLRKKPVVSKISDYDFSGLGVDRLAFIEGWLSGFSRSRLTNQNSSQQYAVLVSAGTATTVDIVRCDGVHFGGYILPGLQLGLDALSEKTGKLPLIELRKIEDPIPKSISTSKAKLGKGSDTISAMTLGSVHATVGGIESILKKYSLDLKVEETNFTMILTGGNSKYLRPFFSDHLEIKSAEDTLAQGIRSIVLGGAASGS